MPRWRTSLLLSLGCTWLAPARGIQLADDGSWKHRGGLSTAVFEPGPVGGGPDPAAAGGEQSRSGSAAGVATFDHRPEDRPLHRPFPVPVFEPVHKDERRRYVADSLAGAQLNVSEDQFMYAFEKTEKYGVEFPSAWLMTRDNFLWWTPAPETWGEKTVVEANIFFPAGYLDITENRVPKTVDFFDFMGVHLSFWADSAEIRGAAPEPDSVNAKVKAYFEDRLSNDIARFQRKAQEASLPQASGRAPRSPLRSQTVALVPFAMSKDRQGANTAGIMLNATFWSLQSQFDSVVLAACHPDDYEFIKRFPAWRVLQFSGEYCAQNGGQYLLSHAIDALSGKLADSPEWKRFEYVYFTEGDIVLYLREHERVLEHLKTSGRALVPHRLDTFPAVGDFSQALRDEARQGYKEHAYFNELGLFSTPVSTVDYDSVSCCLSGRVKSTKEFWWTVRGSRSIFPQLKSVKFASDALPITLASHGAPEVCEVVAGPSCR